MKRYILDMKNIVPLLIVQHFFPPNELCPGQFQMHFMKKCLSVVADVILRRYITGLEYGFGSRERHLNSITEYRDVFIRLHKVLNSMINYTKPTKELSCKL